MRLQFSLRTLLLASTLAAFFCYMWFIWPSRVAHDFSRAVVGLDFTNANAFMDTNEGLFLSFDDKELAVGVRATVCSQTLSQLLCGQRQMYIDVIYFDPNRRAQFGRRIYARASPFGLAATSVVELPAVILRDSFSPSLVHRAR